MAVTRAKWHEHLKPGARKAFIQAAKASTAEYPAFFVMDPSGRAWEDYLVSTGLGTLGLKPEGVMVPFDEPVYRGKVRLTHLTYALGYAVTEEVVEDELYRAIVPPNSRYLMAAQRDGEEIVAAALYNLMFTTQQSYDGVSVINTAHPGVGIADQANRPATDIDISVTAMQGSYERFWLRTDDRGLRLKIMPETVLVHPTASWITDEILMSEKKPFTANNEPNTMKGKVRAKVWRYLTDPDAWFMMTGGGLDNPNLHKAIFSWRRKPRFDDDDSKLEGKIVFFITSRFSVGVVQWQHFDGSPGA